MAAPELLLSPSTGKSPVHSKSYIKVLCFVGLEHDSDTQRLIQQIKAKWPDIEILHSQTGQDMFHQRDIVFFFNDFCGEAFERIVEHNGQDRSGTRIVGPPYIKSRLAIDTGELFCPKIRRPLFSVQMASVVVCLSHDLGSQRKRLAKYIQYMGGRVKKDIQESIRPATTTSQKTCVFVGKGLVKMQRTASLLQMHTLKPHWVEACWSKRDNPNLNVLDKDMLREFAMGAFEGLKIFLLGFTELEYTDMSKNIHPNGGWLVKNVAEATHIVCNPNAPELNKLVLQDHQLAVTDAWFWQSINSLRCLNEEDYFLSGYPALSRSMNSTFNKVKSNNSLADCERSKGSDDFSSDDIDVLSPVTRTPNTPVTPKSPKGYDKRQQVILELLETEKNYVTALNLALRFRTLIEEEWIAKEGETPITRADLQVIFGKISPIIAVHKSILQKLQAHVDSWDRRAPGTPLSSSKGGEKQSAFDLAEIWIREKERLLHGYPPYINSYENGKVAFEAADQKSTRFHVFIRSKESDPEFNRNKLMDLLIRPVQRLPSVTLLLKELQKRTAKQEQIKRIGDAVTVIHEVLTHANTVRFKTDCKIAHLARFTDMDKVPDHLVCSRRQFISELDAVSIIGTGDFQKWPKVDVRILLFNDVCKTRDQISHTSPTGVSATPTGTLRLSTFRRQTSTLHMRKKPLKYIKHIPIQYIRDIRELRDCSDDGGPLQYALPHNGVHLQVITIREDTYADIVWIIHPQSKQYMEATFKYIHQHVQMEYGRTVRSSMPYPLADILSIPELEDVLKKYLKKIGHASHNATFNTMSRGGSMLRRAISSASMSVANRLTKMATSRMETPHRECGEVMRRAPNTPEYDIHPRLDAHSSPDLLDVTECKSPKTGLRARFSTLNLTQTLFRRPSTRQRPMTFLEENKEN